MSLRIISSHFLPALMFGGIFHAFSLGLLLTRFHGYFDPAVSGHYVYYFDILHHRWPASPILMSAFAIFIVLPALLSVVIALVRPLAQLASRPALVTHSLILLAVSFLNLIFYAVMAIGGWNEETF